MKFILLFLLTVFMALFESVIYPIPILLYVLTGCMVLGWEKTFFYALVSGLVLDLVSLRHIGSDSILFLLVTAFIYLYRRRIHPQTPYYLVPYTIISTFIYGMVHFGGLDITWIVVSFISAIFLYVFLFSFLQKFLSRDQIAV